jgi:ABC-type amino acid transport substrate-binding protein
VWATDGAYPPFVTTADDGAPEGLDRDTADAVCAEIDRACSFTVAPWTELFPGLEDGRYDIVFSGLSLATVTAAGLAPSRAYFTAEARFVALRDNAKVIALDTGMAIVGVLAGTPHAAYLEAHIDDPARLRRFPDEEELYLSLLGGSIDAVFADGLTLNDALIAHPADLPVVFAGPAIDDPVFFDPAIVFALAPGDPLVSEIDRALVALAGDGTLRRIVEARLPGYAGGNPTGP